MANREKNDNPFKNESKEHGIKKGDVLYYNRIIPTCGVYDLLEVKVRTIADDWFCVTEKHTKQAYLFSYNKLENGVYRDRKLALKEIKKIQNRKEVL